MYKKAFYIKECVGNNAFSFEERKNKKIFVPSLIEINDFSKIKLGNKISFEDFDFNGNLVSSIGLKNFYKIKWKDKDLYIFDNHNHAFYFWCLAYNEGKIQDKNILYHIDQHSDTRAPEKFFLKKDLKDLQKVFNYTNFYLNVGNYIIPAQKIGIIKDIIQIRSENDLINYKKNPDFFSKNKDIILNLDLDFFSPELDYIDFNLKKEVILNIALKANIITIATSPFFIDQKLALKVFKNIFTI